MNLAIVLVHNKTDAENIAQIEALLPLVDKATEILTDSDGNPYNTYHYEIQGLDLPHEARFFQIIPFGVTPPSNLYELDSHKVFYGKGDEDKTGDHPRFFNWGLKRGTDYGAEVCLHLEDPTQLSVDDLALQLTQLVDPNDKTELIEDAPGKLATLKLLTQVGQLKEDRSLSQAMTDLKTRVSEEGLEHG